MCSRVHKPVTRMRHPGPGFRPDEWAVLVGLDRVGGKDCYLVEFPDGTTSWWPLVSDAGPYEFTHMPRGRGRMSV